MMIKSKNLLSCLIAKQRLLGVFPTKPGSLTFRSQYYKAKPGKQQMQKGGGKPSGKGEAQPPAAPLENNTTIDGFEFLKPKQPCLTTQEFKYVYERLRTLNEGFEDLPKSDRMMLDKLALEIIRLKSSTFYKFAEEGGLGTEDSLYINERKLEDTQIKQKHFNVGMQQDNYEKMRECCIKHQLMDMNYFRMASKLYIL